MVAKSARLGALVIIAGLLLSGCAQARAWGILPTATPASCGAQAADFIAGADDLLARWDDAAALASNTSRIALTGPVGQMQDIRRKFVELPAPECAQATQYGLQRAMDETLEAYLAFMAQASDDTVNAHFVTAAALRETATKWFAELKATALQP